MAEPDGYEIRIGGWKNIPVIPRRGWRLKIDGEPDLVCYELVGDEEHAVYAVSHALGRWARCACDHQPDWHYLEGGGCGECDCERMTHG